MMQVVQWRKSWVVVLALALTACASADDNANGVSIGGGDVAVAVDGDVSGERAVMELSDTYGVDLDELSQAYLNEKIGGRVYFAYDSYALSQEAVAQLQIQADWMMRHGSVNITIAGHCDARGTREYNLALGERRAQSVKNFLIAQGIGGARVSTVSYGKERPAVLGSNEAAYAANRRSVSLVSP